MVFPFPLIKPCAREKGISLWLCAMLLLLLQLKLFHSIPIFFFHCHPSRGPYFLFLFFLSVHVWVFLCENSFLVASMKLRDALNSNERQFEFMCHSMALLRHSQFSLGESSLFFVFFLSLLVCLFRHLSLTKSNSLTPPTTTTHHKKSASKSNSRNTNGQKNVWYDGKKK